MTALQRHACRARDHRGRGMSLVELISVMVIAALIVGVAGGSLRQQQKVQWRTATNVVARDMMFARQLAMSSGLTTWVSFGYGSEFDEGRYTIRQDTPGTPGFASSVALRDPATNADFLENFDPSPFNKVIAGFFVGTGDTFGFDFVGRPVTMAGVLVTTNLSIVITDNSIITIRGITGNVDITYGP
jgi:Tfp pilus assembly protein FimT